MKHKCPGPNCEVQIPSSQLMCRKHWYQVPMHIRTWVYRAWDRGNGAGTLEHRKAIVAAIESITP